MAHASDIGARELRRFGLIVGVVFALVFGVAAPLRHHRPWPLWPWPSALLLIGCALAMPSKLRLFHRVWMRLGSTLGWVNTRVILVLVYFLVVTPLGLLRRAFASRARGREAGRTSYRVESTRSDRLEAPY